MTHFVLIANAFIKWIEEKNIQKPVILFVDGHRTHISMQVSTLCEDAGVILYLLPPNTTHILQPADVGAFKPLKHYWRQQVVDFQRQNPNSVVRRRNVAPLLEKALNKIPKSAIINGFKATGLYPFNVESVDFAKCLDIHEEREDEAGIREDVQGNDELNYIEAKKVLVQEVGLEEFNACLEKHSDFKKLQEIILKIDYKAKMQLAKISNADAESEITSIELAARNYHDIEINDDGLNADRHLDISDPSTIIIDASFINVDEVPQETSSLESIRNVSIQEDPKVIEVVGDFNSPTSLPEVSFSDLDSILKPRTFQSTEENSIHTTESPGKLPPASTSKTGATKTGDVERNGISAVG